MNNIIKSMLEQNIATIDNEICNIQSQIENEIAIAKQVKEQNELSSRFVEIDSKFSELINEMRIELENKIVEKQNEMEAKKNAIRIAEFNKIENEIRAKRSIDLSELNNKRNQLKKEMEG